METNRIIEDLRAKASLDWNPEQKAWFEQQANDARVVECVRMRDVFTPEQMHYINEIWRYKARIKMCYRNAAELVNLIASHLPFLFDFNTLRASRIVTNCCRLNTRLSRLATNTLTRRLNGRCTGTFGKKCTCLASN